MCICFLFSFIFFFLRCYFHRLDLIFLLQMPSPLCRPFQIFLVYFQFWYVLWPLSRVFVLRYSSFFHINFIWWRVFSIYFTLYVYIHGCWTRPKLSACIFFSDILPLVRLHSFALKIKPNPVFECDFVVFMHWNINKICLLSLFWF